jgi:hypothetical protein
MKKICHVFWALLLIAMSSYFVQCKKNIGAKSINTDSSNITLYDKPLSVIQSFIQGSWKLQYIKGGFVANFVYYPTDSTFNLYSTLGPTRIVFKNAARVTLDTTIAWVYIPYRGDSSYAMAFHDYGGVPYTLGAFEMVADTLVLYQPADDGQYFYYTKY